MPSSGTCSDVTSIKPWSHMYNRFACGSTSQTLDSAVWIVWLDSLHNFAVPVFPVDVGKGGVQVLLERDGRLSAHGLRISQAYWPELPVIFLERAGAEV